MLATVTRIHDFLLEAFLHVFPVRVDGGCDNEQIKEKRRNIMIIFRFHVHDINRLTVSTMTLLYKYCE